MRRSSVVLPEPLAPSRVRNSPGATANDTSRRTVVAPKRFETARISSSGSLPAAEEAGSRVRTGCRGMGPTGGEWLLSSRIHYSQFTILLRRFHLVPNLVVLVAARHVFPEIEALEVAVDVFEVK